MLNIGASLRDADASCDINGQTLKNRHENRHVDMIFFKEEEAELLERINCSVTGFLLTPSDVKMTVKSYVDR